MAAPFIPPVRTYTLIFTPPEYEGIEVKVREPIGEEVEQLMIAGAAGLEMKAGNSKIDYTEITKLFKIVGELLVEWNVADSDGNVLPARWDGGLSKQGFQLINYLTQETIDKAMGVGDDLKKGSAGGQTQSISTPPVEIPMNPKTVSTAVA